MSMAELYPELAAFAKHDLKSDPHTIYFEQCGNPNGLPVLFLHGGPGSGCNENHRRYFDPSQYRIILLDQRGCHRSKPNGLLAHNTTQDILNDIEAIRAQLNIEQWVLFGGSWGVTLSLLYAERYPQHVAGMILRGGFLARQSDLDWFVGECGVGGLFPDYWQRLMTDIGIASRAELLPALQQQLHDAERAVVLAAARAWGLYAGRVVTHNMIADYVVDDSDPETLINSAKIEIHYASNRYFIAENQILANIATIPDVPITIIHGRRDLTCRLASSWAIHEVLCKQNNNTPDLIIVPDAGHLAGEPVMVDALVTATDQMAATLQC